MFFNGVPALVPLTTAFFTFPAVFNGVGVRGVENGWVAEVDIAAGGPSPPGVLDCRGLAWFTTFGLTAYVRKERREAGRRAEERRHRTQNIVRVNCVLRAPIGESSLFLSPQLSCAEEKFGRPVPFPKVRHARKPQAAPTSLRGLLHRRAFSDMQALDRV